jgi:LysR family hca operon transcriptional activator
MSLVAATGGYCVYAQKSSVPSVIIRPLHGEVPTFDLVQGYNKSPSLDEPAGAS